MQAICRAADLLRGLEMARRAVTPRARTPIMGCALITADPERGRLEVLGADENVSRAIRLYVPATVGTGGSCAMPVRLMVDAIGTFLADEAHLSWNGKTLIVADAAKKPRLRKELRGLPADDYPRVPYFTETAFDLPADWLRDAVNRVVELAADPSGAGNLALTGVQVSLTPSEGGAQVELVAMDHLGMARVRLRLPGGQFQPSVNLVPASGLKELLRLLASAEQARVGVPDAQHHLLFATEEAELMLLALEGNLPDLGGVFAFGSTTSIQVKASHLHGALRSAEVVSQYVFMNPRRQSLRLQSEASEVGADASEIEAVTEGDMYRFRLPVQRLLTTLVPLLGRTESLVLKLSATTNPVFVYTAESETYLDYVGIVVPGVMPEADVKSEVADDL